MQRFDAKKVLLIAIFASLFTLSLMFFPKEGLAASVEGLHVFFEIVFPSLLPFFILSELLLGLGVVHAIGALVEPLMRPLFRVPGVGAFALSMGLAAGYPMDAVITAKFRQNGLCSRIEGERLLAFTNTADPLFLFGAVAVGMLKAPPLGIIIAIAHYVSSFLVGFTFRFYGRKEERRTQVFEQEPPRRYLLRHAYHKLIAARQEDGRPFGQMLGDAVHESVRTLFMIGGFIVIFSVFLRILNVISATKLPMMLLGSLLTLFHLSPSLAMPTIAGIFEIDLGTSATAALTQVPLVEKIAIISAIIAWSGLSVHAQVASVLTKTDIRMRPYVIARIYHALLAFLIAYLMFPFFSHSLLLTASVSWFTNRQALFPLLALGIFGFVWLMIILLSLMINARHNMSILRFSLSKKVMKKP